MDGERSPGCGVNVLFALASLLSASVDDRICSGACRYELSSVEELILFSGIWDSSALISLPHMAPNIDMYLVASKEGKHFHQESKVRNKFRHSGESI